MRTSTSSCVWFPEHDPIALGERQGAGVRMASQPLTPNHTAAKKKVPVQPGLADGSCAQVHALWLHVCFQAAILVGWDCIALHFPPDDTELV